MRALKIILGCTAILALVVFGSSRTVTAFHSGGVAECGGCHSMHSPAPSGSYLLVGGDASSTCLSCHMRDTDTGPTSYHVSTVNGALGAGQAPLQRNPGGDFGWLKKSYTFTVRGDTITEEGETHGHNVIAGDYGYVVDNVNTSAPGGTFPSGLLGCNSCHDPHGRYRRLSDNTVVAPTPALPTGAPILGSGSYPPTASRPDPPPAGLALGVYRLLAGNGYIQDRAGDLGGPIVAGFTGVPAAKAPSSYNRSEAVNQVRVAYGLKATGGHSSWGNWCGTCHPAMHSSGNYVHPVDQSLSNGGVKAIYDAYVMTGDLGGENATAFTSLVPFVTNSDDYGGTLATLAVSNDSQQGGPAGTDQVTCLSCHRAHASGWEYALRWNMEGEFITVNSLYPGTDSTPTVPQFARGRTEAETQAAYYDRPVTVFASYQRVLCNKCHAKD